MNPAFWTRHGLALLTFSGLMLYALTADFFGKEIVAEVAVFAILAMSVDLAAGYGGMVSLGHGALFGTGAYLYGMAAVQWGWPGGPAVLFALLSVGGLGLLVGALVCRLQGIFFIMTTLAIGEMGHEYFFKSKRFGGDDGMSGIPRLDLGMFGVDLADPTVFAMALVFAAMLVYVLLARLLVSPYGWTIVGVHHNESRMLVLGLPVNRYKSSLLGVSAALAGFAGALAAMHTQFITPELLSWTNSGQTLVMVILGGLGTLVGPVLGAALVIGLRHELSGFTDYWGFWLGLFLILVVMSGTNGVSGFIEDMLSRIGRVLRRPNVRASDQQLGSSAAEDHD